VRASRRGAGAFVAVALSLALSLVTSGCGHASHASESTRSPDSAPRAVGQGGWEELDSGDDAPPAGEDTAAVLDPARHRVLLYGGKGDDDRNRNELWAFDLAAKSWSRIAPDGAPPPPREDHTLILDSGNDALVLFGGEDGSTTNSTWRFDLATNRWSDVTDASAPELEGHVAIYDPREKRMIVFGGVCEEKARKDDKVVEDSTWALDPIARRRAPAPGRSSRSRA
jgi:hypothetical protein